MEFQPAPLSIMAFSIMMKYLAGNILHTYCKNVGILSMGNINPENSIVGINRENIEVIMAVC